MCVCLLTFELLVVCFPVIFGDLVREASHISLISVIYDRLRGSRLRPSPTVLYLHWL